MFSQFPKKWIILGAVLLLLFLGGIILFLSLQKGYVRDTSFEEEIPLVPKEVSGPKIRIVGSSVLGRKIEAYTYGTGPTHIAFVGGVHGGYEWNTVLLAYRMMDYFSANPKVIPSTLSVTIVPNANPDGLFKVIGKEGRFLATDVPASLDLQASGRFNANDVDLNRNFDCEWQPESTWRNNVVSAGTKAFSEPEAVAIRDFVLTTKPVAVVFWHSQSGNVYASDCEDGILPETLTIMNAYAKAGGYGAIKKFDAYKITGDAEGWLAKIGVPSITVEFTTHQTLEWEKNLAGVLALLEYYSNK